jgi:hypothetical protein
MKVYVVWSDYTGLIIGFFSTLERACELASNEIRLQENMDESCQYDFLSYNDEVEGTYIWYPEDNNEVYEDYCPLVEIREEILDSKEINRGY